MSDSLQPHGLQPTRLFCLWNSSDNNTGMGCYALLQGIFLTQGLNLHFLCLLHWQMGSLPLVPPGKPHSCCISGGNPTTLQSHTCGGGLLTKLCLTLVTPWKVAHLVPLSMGFPRKEHWSGWIFPSPRGLPTLGSNPCLLALQMNSLPLSHQRCPQITYILQFRLYF